MKLTYKVNETPKPFAALLVFALQQLLAIMSATLLVPIIVGNGMSPAAALFGAGIGTIVYVLFTQRKSPVFLGSSFAFLGSMAAAFAGGVSAALGYFGLILGAILAGLAYVVIALIVKVCGVAWIDRLMPAVIIGPTVAIIGLSLAGGAVENLSTPVQQYEQIEERTYEAPMDKGMTSSSLYILAKNGQDPDTMVKSIPQEGGDAWDVALKKDDDGNLVEKDGKNVGILTIEQKVKYPSKLNGYLCLLCGLVTLAVTMYFSVYGKKMSKLIPFVLGILAGYALAFVFTAIGWVTDNNALVIINAEVFTQLTDNGVTLKTLFTVPEFTFKTAFKAFEEGISASYIVKIAAAYLPVAFVVFAEHLADHKNISSIIETDLLKDPGLHRTLLGDGVGSMAGAFFGGCPNTTYGESIGCVAITGNASVTTIVAASVMAIIVSFLSPFVAFLSSIPNCIVGGVCMALYGFIAVSGLKMLRDIDLGENRNLFVVSVILIAGIGGLQLTFGIVTITSVACALILGILTNLMVKGSEKKDVAAQREKE